jgi:hypothetical protein
MTSPFLRALDKWAAESAKTSQDIGRRRVRKALTSTLELWRGSPPGDVELHRLFRDWLRELARRENDEAPALGEGSEG